MRIKQQLPMLFLTVLLATTARAQSHKFEIGIQGSPSLIGLRGNEMVNDATQTGLGLSAGIAAQYRLTQKLALQTSIGFERKGSFSKGVILDTSGNTIGDVKCLQQFDYLVLPILLRFHFGKQQQFYVNVGPYLGYLLRQNNTVKSDIFPDYCYSDMAYFKHLDAGVSAGFGLNVPVNEVLRLSVECRENLGLSNMSLFPVFENGKVQNHSFNLMIGLHYLLRNK